MQRILADEQAHESRLAEMLDEEQLKYVGSMVLGLNDALVTLSGTIFSRDMYAAALITMLAVVILIIFVFNYYISVAKSLPFGRRFGEMAAIGLAAKSLLGVDL